MKIFFLFHLIFFFYKGFSQTNENNSNQPFTEIILGLKPHVLSNLNKEILDSVFFNLKKDTILKIAIIGFDKAL